MDTTLYQFPISHYSEKARWTLDYKGIVYQPISLLPGLHVKTLRHIVPGKTVPVLLIHNEAIQGSDLIIDYLDQQFPAKSLTPQNATQRQQASEWEIFAAEKIADPLRCFYYHHLLDHPKTLIPLFCEDRPWYGKFFMKLMYKQLKQRMREGYQINQRNAQLAMRVVDKAILKLEAHLADHSFLVGDRFSRADLSVCALLSPLVLPERGYMKQSALSAQALLDYRKLHVHSPVFRWVNAIYNTYR